VSIIITAEVWQYAPTGKGDLLVLLRIADAAGDDHRMMWESVKTLAKRTRMSERGVYNSLRNLEKQNIIEAVPKEEAPPEAALYASVVRRIRPVQDWVSKPESEVVDMQNLQGSNRDKDPLQNLHPAQVSYNPSNQLVVRDIEETTFLPPRRAARSDPGGAEEISTRPGTRGWDAVAAPRRGGRKKTRKQVAEEATLAEKELDPAYVVAQALGEEDSGSSQDARLPASDDDLAPPVRRPREKRSRRPSEELAEFFGKRAQEVGHPVPGATNLQALTGNFGRWLREGAEREEIRRMVITYWSSSWNRSENHPAWKDFLGARGLLTERLGKSEKVKQVEDTRYDPDYWS
jgi:DNA-binding Lrp family transcriptional regulator